MKNNQYGLQNILFNIVIPVLILNKGSYYLSPTLCLIVALSFPLFFGLLDYFKSKKANFFSVLGFINISLTGSLALSGLGGIWFCLKEAIFPLLIGVFVFLSASRKNPILEIFLLNPDLINTDLVNEKIASSNNQQGYKNLIISGTRWLSLSFLMSAVFNFALALFIFTPLSESLSTTEKSELLNSQIAKMTTYSMAVILIPNMIFLLAILFKLIKQLEHLTGLSKEEIFKS